MLKSSKNPYRETLNDGYLIYGKKITERTASLKKIGETFLEEGKLAFRILSARESDYQMIGAMNSSLDLKVKTLNPPKFLRISKNDLTVYIKNEEYDVIKADRDDDRTYLYFYLQKVGVRIE
ncbi:phage head-tail adapter protein [Paenisporosarcina macmurdoensis]|uniref:Phage head-tail adapter protein n=1 Tax=Paenisporosarcina macmurdoensis TaxID=212659 RepID=A0ABW1L300_9BACL